ncbi:hypothetical protein NJ7G_1152 [Natrinema sp. J7-2]|nr:hypothetical protein NJ7G_1152 [Natrinema sp. J7-2]
MLSDPVVTHATRPPCPRPSSRCVGVANPLPCWCLSGITPR